MSAYDNLAFCTYFGIDALKTKKKAYIFGEGLFLNFLTYVWNCLLNKYDVADEKDRIYTGGIPITKKKNTYYK